MGKSNSYSLPSNIGYQDYLPKFQISRTDWEGEMERATTRAAKLLDTLYLILA